MSELKEMVVLRDANGHLAPFEPMDLLKQLAEQSTKMFGLTLPVIAELRKQALMRHCPVEMTVADVQKAFEK